MWRVFRDIGGLIWWGVVKLGRTKLELEQAKINWSRNVNVSICFILLITYLILKFK